VHHQLKGIHMVQPNSILAAVVLAVSSLAATPLALAGTNVTVQASCGSPSTEVVQGGYVVTRYCDGRRFRGVGSTIDDAVANINAMASLVPYGIRCTYSGVEGGPGAFITDFTCTTIDSEGGPINVFSNLGEIGTTLTDAGNNAYGFAQLYAVTRYKCRPSQTVAVPGGYVTDFGCSYPNPDGPIQQSTRISGVGSTSTDSGQNNLGFAELAAAVDVKCSTSASSIKIVGLAVCGS
jgi:hypothetical protein